MCRRRRATRRRGASVVEVAITVPVAFLLVLAIIVGALGVFRYQQVASAAREGARWASVRGEAYEQTTGKAKANEANVIDYVKSRVASLEGADIDVIWPATKDTIVVTITYVWLPEALLLGFTGPITLKSQSEVPMSF